MAAEYLQQQSEMAELREYKAKIADKIKENQEIIDSKTPTAEDMKQYNRLKDEKVWKMEKREGPLTFSFQDALLVFKGKLTEQLMLIQEAQLKKSGEYRITEGGR